MKRKNDCVITSTDKVMLVDKISPELLPSCLTGGAPVFDVVRKSDGASLLDFN